MTTIYVTPDGIAIIPISGGHDGHGKDNDPLHDHDEVEGGFERDIIGSFVTEEGQPVVVTFDGGVWFINGEEADLQDGKDAEWVQRAIAGEPSTSGGRSADSIAVDARAAADRAESARQFDLRLANDQARDEETLAFNVAKERSAIAEGNEERALRAHGLVEQITARIQETKLRREQLLVETAAEIGRLAANPADVGQLAGFLRAGLTQRELINSGQNAITAESAAPIQSLLQTQRNLVNQPPGQIPSFEQFFNAVDPNFTSELDSDVVAGDTANDGTGVVSGGLGHIPAVLADPAVAGPLPELSNRFPTREEEIARFFREANLSPDAEEFVPQRRPLGFADGGTTHAPAAIVGEEGPELMTRNADGSVTITPMDDIPGMADGGTMGVPRKSTGQPVGSEGLGFVTEFFNALSPQQQIAAGGTGPEITAKNGPPLEQVGKVEPPTTGDVTLQEALDFLGKSGQDALKLGGFANASETSPLKVAAPGTSRFLRDLSASTSAALGFGPQSLFFEELLRLIPRGVQAQVRGRTA
jgi:hypothetical protein